jgi:hypothetical protein
MRKRILPVVAIALCLFLTGCGDLMSLYPLYSKDVLTTDDSLIGRWEEHDKGSDAKKDKQECCWVFAKSDDGYALTIPNGEHNQIWLSKAHLVRLGGTLFMDVEPRTPDYKRPTEVSFPSMDLHMIFRIWIEKDTVRMAMLDMDGLKAAQVSGKTQLPLINHKDDILLTGTTEQLQAFFTEHANDDGLFESAPDMIVTLKRMR